MDKRGGKDCIWNKKPYLLTSQGHKRIITSVFSILIPKVCKIGNEICN